MNICKLRLFVGSLMVGFCAIAFADELVAIPTREGVTSSYWWMPRNNAKANLILLSGGHDPTGDECEALHWHGFINHEAQASKAITDWILKPAP